MHIMMLLVMMMATTVFIYIIIEMRLSLTVFGFVALSVYCGVSRNMTSF